MVNKGVFKFGFGGSSKGTFTPPEKKGEINELKAQLRDREVERDPVKKREALKKVIAYMTLGVDTTALAPEMIMTAATKDLVIKKMVYLYMSVHADASPEISLLAINTLQKDCKDESPIVRGLALRTISSLRVPNVVEYLIPVLQKAMTDSSAYVKKTAIVSCVKLFRMDRPAFESLNVLDKLYSLIRDHDTNVCCNAVMALEEILNEDGGMQLNKAIVVYLLNRTRDLSEWQNCMVLQLVLRHTAESDQEMFDILNLLEERLRGSNSAVILATTNMFLHLTQNQPAIHKQVYSRLKEPLLTLCATTAMETAYQCLCHIRLLISREPQIFYDHFKDFFWRYNDPSYVKSLKLEVLVTIACDANVKQIVEELSAYAQDIQPDTSRKAIRAMGQIALRLAPAAQVCVPHFLEFLETDTPHVRAETFVVLKDFLRKYTSPDVVQPFFSAITTNYKEVDDMESKVAFIWIMGEFGEDIEQAPYILEDHVEGFADEPHQVRIELLTACMKLFFKRPPEMQPILGPLLNAAITDNTHADVHDRALLYYRLLLKNPRVAALVVGSKKESVQNFNDEENAEVKDKLFEEFNTLSIVYNTPSDRFIVKTAGILGEKDGAADDDEEESEEEDEESEEEEEDSEEEDDEGAMEKPIILVEEKEAKAYKEKDRGLVLSPNPLIDEEIFQGKWMSMQVATTIEMKLRNQPPSDIVEGIMARNNINCMAAGAMDGSLKFYFYAQTDPQLNGSHFLSETVIGPDGTLIGTVKADHDRVSQFAHIFKTAMKRFL